ncbi:hypothetical protein OJ963_31120 [Streptomyces sp. RS2]|uniref:hypothetical protein n=1 Tax=Streptomyces sp. RS2 TaxID=1451205 RepID=UPI0021F8C2D8|nr:hypothetical protein [Streptomyces sp. RS2]MCW1098298.1 hypothetical protein [Streptomyces sp. RS2]
MAKPTAFPAAPLACVPPPGAPPPPFPFPRRAAGRAAGVRPPGLGLAGPLPLQRGQPAGLFLFEARLDALGRGDLLLDLLLRRGLVRTAALQLAQFLRGGLGLLAQLLAGGLLGLGDVDQSAHGLAGLGRLVEGLLRVVAEQQLDAGGGQIAPAVLGAGGRAGEFAQVLHPLLGPGQVLAQGRQTLLLFGRLLVGGVVRLGGHLRLAVEAVQFGADVLDRPVVLGVGLVRGRVTGTGRQEDRADEGCCGAPAQ